MDVLSEDLLDVLHGCWVAGEKSEESVVSYVMMIRERLEKMAELVKQNMDGAQATQKDGMISMPDRECFSQETKYWYCCLLPLAS